jgi:hypothetical protein
MSTCWFLGMKGLPVQRVGLHLIYIKERKTNDKFQCVIKATGHERILLLTRKPHLSIKSKGSDNAD